MGKVIPHEKPDWCPHESCQYLRNGAGIMCIGKLSVPTPHNGDFNTHRICLWEGGPTDFQVNKTDVGWFEYLFEVMKD